MTRTIEFPALFLYPVLGLLQTAGYSVGDDDPDQPSGFHYRGGEARSYVPPDPRWRGQFAIFGSRTTSYGEDHLKRTGHFRKAAERRAFLACAARYAYRLIGFAELVAIHKPGSRHYDRVFASSLCRKALHGETLIYETRPLGVVQVAPEESPLFNECCVGCIKHAKEPRALKNHLVSSHTRWQCVRLPERFVP